MMSSTPESYQLEALPPDSVWSVRHDEVAVVAGVGPLEDVVDDLRRAVLLALADEPRAVVCDLTGVHDGREADARVLLTTMAEQVRDWPAVPVAVPCPDKKYRNISVRAPSPNMPRRRTQARDGCSIDSKDDRPVVVYRNSSVALGHCTPAWCDTVAANGPHASRTPAGCSRSRLRRRTRET